MEKDIGRSADGSGFRGSHEAADASSPKASIPSAPWLDEGGNLQYFWPVVKITREEFARRYPPEPPTNKED